MRIAVFTLEALAAAAAVRRYVLEDRARIAFVGLSNPYRPQAGGAIGQAWRHVKRSGVGFLPYLLANFSLPRLAGLLPPGSDASVERVPLARTCRKLGIPVETVADVNDAATRALLVRHGVELIVSFHVDQIFSPETLASVPQGGINVHAAMLPAHRGPVPTLHALLDDPPRFGVTIHRLAAKIDAGPMLAQQTVTLPPGLSSIGAALALHRAAVPLLRRVVGQMEAGQVEETGLDTHPYCGFPTRATMRALAARGAKAASAGDLLAALRTPV